MSKAAGVLSLFESAEQLIFDTADKSVQTEFGLDLGPKDLKDAEDIFFSICDQTRKKHPGLYDKYLKMDGYRMAKKIIADKAKRLGVPYYRSRG
jgi:hypothetical protein